MGSFVDILLSLCMFWTGLHAFKHIVTRFYFAQSSRQLTRHRAVLPLDAHISAASQISSFSHFIGHKAARIFHELQLNVSLTAVNFRVETTVLNTSFDKASVHIAQDAPWPYPPKFRLLSEQFYSLGIATGLSGMALGYMLLFWSCLMVFRGLGSNPGTSNPTDLEDEPLSSSEGSLMGGTGLAVQPIIPGVTVPLSHVPILLGALLVSQVIHEAGHAFTAVIESVPINSVGIGLFVCLPSAFVSLGSAAFDKLSPVPRMRIATAGAYHNIVLWLIIAILGWSDINNIMNQGWTGWGTPLGPYRSVDDLGVAIRSIEQESDLSYHLFPGDIITRIEDTILSRAHLLKERRTPLQLWHDLLLHHHHNVTIDDLPDMGWCVDKKWYEGQPTSCCTQSSPSSLVCFAPAVSYAKNTGRCLDAFKVFDPPETPMAISHGRCASKCITADTAVAEDEPDQVCVRSKGITRIGVVRNNQDEKTILWSGPSEEIWEQVRVTDIAPRYWFVPSGLPDLVALFISYTSTITLSLYFLNLLPIRHLDGAQVLSALMDLYAPQPSSLLPPSPGLTIEEGPSGYPLTSESSARRPRISRRHTPSSRSQASNLLHIQEPEDPNWISKNRAMIERIAEGTAIGLVAITAAGNVWILSRST
ncbi:Peptidase family M50 [Rhizoctonia solani]|uniref:Endopeptidase S2P n=1 Tax=Rhizoctonia solani TaxID=456999 RepID=A0A8H7HE54_9AGAM|nr:Peptidase family M50 [Rhizoctonia solani]